MLLLLLLLLFMYLVLFIFVNFVVSLYCCWCFCLFVYLFVSNCCFVCFRKYLTLDKIPYAWTIEFCCSCSCLFIRFYLIFFFFFFFFFCLFILFAYRVLFLSVCLFVCLFVCCWCYLLLFFFGNIPELSLKLSFCRHSFINICVCLRRRVNRYTSSMSSNLTANPAMRRDTCKVGAKHA